MTFSNVYADGQRAESYARLEFPGTYYLAYRDLPAILAEHVHGKAEQHAPERGEDAGERQADPERQSEIGRQQRVGIGADRVERDIAEVEQAGEADDDAEAERQQDPVAGDEEDGDPEVPAEHGQDLCLHQRRDEPHEHRR
mgnify:CR=1 FL=1